MDGATRSTKPNETERELPQLSLRAEFRPGAINAEKRTAEIIWTTGARVLRGWFDQYYEELSLDPKHVRLERLNNGAPLLDTHRLYETGAVLGVVESAKIDGKMGVATVRFARAEDDPQADSIFRKVKDGIIQNISVGYRIHRLEKIESGEGKIPVYRATDWEPIEVSVVPVGADDGAGFRSVEKSNTNRCLFVSHSEERIMDHEAEKSGTTRSEQPEQPPVRAEQSGETKRGTEPAPGVSQAEATRSAESAVKAERERAATIRALLNRQTLIPVAERAAFGDDLIARGLPLEEARAAILDRLATESEKFRTEQHVRIESGAEEESQKRIQAAVSWLISRSGQGPLLRRAEEKMAKIDARRAKVFKVDEGFGDFGGMNLRELARDMLQRSGLNTRGMPALEIAHRAFSTRANYQTTSDFGTILETALHKILLAGYALVDDTWPRFCGRTTMVDFRAHNFYRLGMFGALDAVNEAGEFQRKVIPDGEKESITLGTYGNIIGLSRKAVVDDDMGAFTRLASTFGLAAGLTVEEAVYSLLALHSGFGPALTDGYYLFDASNRDTGNVGTGAALTAASIDADRAVMGAHRDLAGKRFLSIRPSVLVVPLGLGGLARSINKSEKDPDTAGSNKPNVALGTFTDIVDTPYLTAGSTRRYMFADPAMSPAIVVGFLEGQEEPVMETRDGFEVDGMEWKVRLDFAVGAVEWRTALTNAGAA